MKFVELLLGLLVGTGKGLQVRDPMFDVLDVFSCFGGCVHEWES
jgi:hypothetical protein